MYNGVLLPYMIAAIAGGAVSLLPWVIPIAVSRATTDDPSVIAVTATDYALEAPPRAAAGALTIRLRNRGLRPHHAQVVRLDSGRTLRDLEQALVATGTLPAWAHEIGGSGPVEPGAEADVTVPVRRGRHVLLCAERSDDGTPSLLRGMYRELTVAGLPGDSRAPLSDAALVLSDEETTYRGSIAAGHRRLHVGNRGSASADVILYRLRDGRREGDLLGALATPGSPAVADAAGGVVGLPPGGWGVVALRVSPGRYAVVRRTPQRHGGKGSTPTRVIRWIHVK